MRLWKVRGEVWAVIAGEDKPDKYEAEKYLNEEIWHNDLSKIGSVSRVTTVEQLPRGFPEGLPYGPPPHEEEKTCREILEKEPT